MNTSSSYRDTAGTKSEQRDTAYSPSRGCFPTDNASLGSIIHSALNMNRSDTNNAGSTQRNTGYELSQGGTVPELAHSAGACGNDPTVDEIIHPPTAHLPIEAHDGGTDSLAGIPVPDGSSRTEPFQTNGRMSYSPQPSSLANRAEPTSQGEGSQNHRLESRSQTWDRCSEATGSCMEATGIGLLVLGAELVAYPIDVASAIVCGACIAGTRGCCGKVKIKYELS